MSTSATSARSSTGALVTQEHLDARLSEFRASIEGRFDSVESRFDSIEGRFDSVESRFGSVESRFDSRFSDFKDWTENLLELRIAELRIDNSELRGYLEKRMNDQTKWLTGWITFLVFGAVGLVIGLT